MILLALALSISPGTHVIADAAASSEEGLEVIFINVGQGDAILVKDPGGFNILIDGGLPSAGPLLIDFLREQEIDKLDVIVATHPHNDHFGGLTALLRLDDIPVRAVYHNGYPSSTRTWRDFVDAVHEEGLALEELHYPQEISWGEIEVEVLNPLSNLEEMEPNDVSIVLLFTYGKMRFLLTADIDRKVEGQVLERYQQLEADFLKVAHHGDATSTGSDFISAVKPREAVIQVGENRSGQPSLDVVQRLEKSGARVWRTDRHGHISLVTDGQTYAISSEVIYTFIPVLLGGGLP